MMASLFTFMNKKHTSSVRKFIRLEKAQIRRQFWDIKKQKEMIDAMYRKISGQQNPEEKLAEEVVAKEKQNAKKVKTPKIKVDKKPKVKKEAKSK